MQIKKISYYDYTGKTGLCFSVENFTSEKMIYTEACIETTSIPHIESFSRKFRMSVNLSVQVRESMILHLDDLSEINEMLAVNSPRYIIICFIDDSKIYFAYNKDFCDIFEHISGFKPKANSVDIQNKNDNNSKHLPEKSMVRFEPKNNNQNRSSKNELNIPLSYVGFILICLILLFFGITQCVKTMDDSRDDMVTKHSVSSTTTKKNLVPVEEPISGTILSGVEDLYGSQIKIITSGNAYVVKLKTIDGVDVMSFYVRADDEVTVGVPAEEFYVYFASGDTWYGNKHLFGEKTNYSKDDEIKDFTDGYWWTYKLYPVTGGNFSETPIEAEEF